MVLILRLVSLQFWAGEAYTTLARNQHEKRTVLEANRGRILDRHKRVLATALEAQSFFINKTPEIDSLKTIAVWFSQRVGADETEVLNRLKGKLSFTWLARKVVDGPSEDQMPDGVGRIIEMRRSYPMGQVAAQVLGYTDIDNVGIEGIELAFDPLLKGKSGEMASRVDARGNVLSALGAVRSLPEDGKDLVLTLDADIQSIAEEELETGVAHFKAESGIAIVMEPHTGEILAMANVPLYDSNLFSLYDPKIRRNRAVTDMFEPGSTFKVVAVAGAVEEGMYEAEDAIFCEGGKMMVSGGTIRDTHPSEWLTVRQIIEQSSNIGTAKIARRLGRVKLFRYTRLFGFGNLSGSDLPGEISGDLKHPSRWSDRSLETISIGQEVGVSALQLASAYGAIANRGRLMIPRIFQKAVQGDNSILLGRSEEVRQVVSARAAAMVTSFLEGVVNQGTGTNARIPGYRVAGKTGTAQRAYEDLPGYDPNRYISSFVGFLPADAPELLCLVVVDSPQGKRLGSQVAAPIFRRILQRILSLWQTRLRHRSTELRLPYRPLHRESPVLTGLSRNVAERVVARQGFSPRFIGSGGRVLSQNLRLDRKEALLLTELDDKVKPEHPHLVPNVIGLQVRQAIFQITAAGFQVMVSGNGSVVKQLPEPGKKVKIGTLCRIVCKRQ